MFGFGRPRNFAFPPLSEFRRDGVRYFGLLMSKFVRVLVLLGFGVALAAVAGWFVLDEPLEYWLDCNRFSGTCTFTQKFVIRTHTTSARVGTLRKAEVRLRTLGKSRIRQSVWVLSDRGDHFVADYRSRAEAEEAAEKINAFLRDPGRGRLLVTRTDRMMYWVAWGLVPISAAFLVAVFSVFSAKKPAPGRDS